jgi:hypothetical protein
MRLAAIYVTRIITRQAKTLIAITHCSALSLYSTDHGLKSRPVTSTFWIVFRSFPQFSSQYLHSGRSHIIHNYSVALLTASLNNHIFTLRYCSHTATKMTGLAHIPTAWNSEFQTDSTDWCVIASTQVAALHGGSRHNSLPELLFY